MKKILIFLLLVFLLVSFVFAVEDPFCKSVQPADTSCTVKTLATTGCSSYNYTLYSLTEGFINEDYLRLLHDDFYYIPFNQPEGSYYIINCDNTEVQILVEEEELGDFTMAAIIFGIICVIAFFIWLGSISEHRGLRFLSWGIALIELVVLAGTIYGISASKDVSTLMNVNFIGLLIIGFGVGMYILYEHSTRLINPSEKHDDDADRKKWRG